MIARLSLLAMLATGAGATPVARVPRESAAPVRATRVDLRLVRVAGRSGTLLVSNGIPLAPGTLRSADRALVRVLVDGREQPAYVEPLRGTHPDGSVRSVLVQFRAAVPSGDRAAAVLDVGTRSAVPRLARSATLGKPAAVALPASADYLVSTLAVGPTLTVRDAARLTPAIRKHDESFSTFADRHWKQDGAGWEGGNYYDRAMIYYVAWARTANPEYWRRGTEMALDYRRNYLEKNNFAATPHWSMLDGVALHYELTGDEASRTAVGRVAQTFTAPYYMNNLQDTRAEMENRMQARVLLGFVIANSIAAPRGDARPWDALAREALTKILASQSPDGAYRFKRGANIGQCGYNKPFMVGILNDAMIRYHTRFEPDRRILPAVKKSLDYMWTKDWRPRERSFVYLDGPCEGSTVGVSPDLNNLLITGYAWYGKQSGDASYLRRADEIFAGAVATTWLDGSKQFNQQYTAAHNYIGYRASR
jgi:hypothetical protein